MFHVFEDLEYPCILGIDFICGSKIILDFDPKFLAIPDSQIDKVVKINRGLHALYHEIDTGDNSTVVSRPYRRDRLKQKVLYYHVDKMLKGTKVPIQSPCASPVVLCKKIKGYRKIIWKRIDLLSIIGNLMQLQSTPVIPYP
ncbi:hypothetical protein TNCV_2465301 [Trichonephila clavipes]|uniref:Uncharacterized protein n=1 Tax=Trichonephila clavipes TaxID=2585209 RepID=A0A8X6R866_TRICX|nr:hypothetical protein TNCV_2465301 [Trichonephila clavipes]